MEGRSRSLRRLWPAVVAAGVFGAAVFASGAPLTPTTSAGGVPAGAAGSPLAWREPSSATPSSSDPEVRATDEDASDSPALAVGRLMAARSAALAARDREAWAMTVSEPDSDEGRRQMTLYDNLVALGIVGLTVADPQPANTPVASPGATATPSHGHAVTVLLGHAIPGFDREPRVATRTVTVVRREDGWRITRDRDDTDQVQVFDLPGLRVVRSDTVLVAGNAPVATLEQRLADAEAAHARLTRLFGTPTPSVLVVPVTASEAAGQLGAAGVPASGQVAATTDGQIGPGGTAVADRVVVHPDAFESLTVEGRRVVVTHEMTHVAARRAIPGSPPLWLSEGLAEYVAWCEVSMPVEAAAGRLVSVVRASGAPQGLPGPADFDPTNADVATAYQASWLAVRAIAADHGEARLLAFYRAASAAPSDVAVAPGLTLNEALRTELGTTTTAFVASWQAGLERLAGR